MMKQRITIEQLNEINDAQKERLREWWKPQDYDLVAYGEQVLVAKVSGTCIVELGNEGAGIDASLPLLSIGQMIELLDDDRQSNVSVPISQILPNYHLHYTDSLCDVLWGAVKQILKDTPTP